MASASFGMVSTVFGSVEPCGSRRDGYRRATKSPQRACTCGVRSARLRICGMSCHREVKGLLWVPLAPGVDPGAKRHRQCSHRGNGAS